MIIKTKDFILRPIRLSDAKGYFDCRKDEEAKKGFMACFKSVAEAKKDLNNEIASMNRKVCAGETFTIEVNGEFAGSAEVHDLNRKYFKHKGTISYGLHKKFRGKGMATKAVQLVTSYALKKYKLKRIEGWCRTYNKASARVLEKCGYKLEGILRKNKIKDGKYLDDMVWAKVK